jgi:hypothetical protein
MEFAAWTVNLSVFAGSMSWRSFRDGFIFRSVKEDFPMSSIHSAITERQAQSIRLATQFPSTQLTKRFPEKSLTFEVQQGLLKIAAWMRLRYRQEKGLNSEEFYQRHVSAIFMGLYVEIFSGVLAGIASVWLFGLWAL